MHYFNHSGFISQQSTATQIKSETEKGPTFRTCTYTGLPSTGHALLPCLEVDITGERGETSHTSQLLITHILAASEQDDG